MLFFYEAFERLKLCSPFLVVPGMAALSVFLYLFYPAHLLYGHFLLDGGLFIAVYLAMVFRWGYRSTDAFVLTVCAMIAADQLWQVPLFAYDWPRSLLAAEVGVFPAFIALTGLPLMFYFLLYKARRKMGLNGRRLVYPAALTVFAVPFGYAATWDYLLFFVWIGAFAWMFRSSRDEKVLRDPAVLPPQVLPPEERVLRLEAALLEVEPGEDMAEGAD